MATWKRLAKVVAWIFAGIIAFFILAFGYLYTHKTEIKTAITTAISAQLNTKINVGEIDIDFFSKFPQVALKFSNVRAEEALENSQQPLFLFKGIYVRFSIWDLLGSDYTIRKLSFDDGEINLRITKDGLENYIFWKETEGETDTKIALEDVAFNNAKLRYKDETMDLQVLLQLQSLRLTGNFDALETKLNIEGNGTLLDIFYEDMDLADSIPLLANGQLVYRNGETQIGITELKLAEIVLKGTGVLRTGYQSYDLTTKDAPLRSWLQVVPKAYRPTLVQQNIGGSADAHFTIVLSEKINEITASATLKKGTYNDAPNFVYLEEMSAQFGFKYAYSGKKTSGSLSLKNFAAKTKTGNIALNASIVNLEAPHLTANGSIKIKVEELLNMTRPGLIKQARGLVSGTFSYSQKFANWEEMSSKALTSPVLEGKLLVSEGGITFENSNIDLRNIEAELSLHNRDIVIERLFAREGKSEFLLDGWMFNTLYVGPNRPTPQINVRLQSQNVDLNSILEWQFPRSAGDTYSTDKTEPFAANFKVVMDVKKFNLISFTGTNFTGEIWNDGLTIKGKDILLNGLSGKIDGSFSLAVLPNGYRFWTKSHLEKIDINKLFLAFENFGQNWLLASNIYGTGTATVETSMDFNDNFDINPASLKMLLDISILNGRLKGYKPLESLSSIVDKKALEDVSFERLENKIAINNEVITIPLMEIKSSALSLVLKGRHSFDQQIDYSIRLALKDVIKKKKPRTDLDSWIVEVETTDQPYIWIHVGCHIDNPCLSLDREILKKGVKEEWKQQGEDIRNIFKPTKTTEPKKDPTKGELIFEWEEEETDTTDRN